MLRLMFFTLGPHFERLGWYSRAISQCQLSASTPMSTIRLSVPVYLSEVSLKDFWYTRQRVPLLYVLSQEYRGADSADSKTRDTLFLSFAVAVGYKLPESVSVLTLDQ